MRGTWAWPRAETSLPASGRHYRSASTRRAALLHLLPRVADQLSSAQQQTINHIRAELLVGTALFACGCSGVQHLDQHIQARQRTAKPSPGCGLRGTETLRITPLTIRAVMAIHAGQQGRQQVFGVIEQGFEPLGRIGRQPVDGIANQGGKMGKFGACGHGEFLADGKPPAEARWRTVRVGVPDNSRQVETPADFKNPLAPSAAGEARCIVFDAKQNIGDFLSNS